MMFTVHDLTTQELLNARGAFRAYDVGDDELVFVGSRNAPGGQQINVCATHDEIMAELNTRPHVPSSKESRVIRQLKAKTHQSEEWLRAHTTYGQEIALAGNPRKMVSVREYQWIAKAYGKQHASRHYKIQQGVTNG
jgi:mRNA deadenylase 3'-5' endonuclease subunit Ccr4